MTDGAVVGESAGTPTRVGVLALQGAFREHARLLSQLGAEVVLVRTPEQLDGLDAVVLPGGESTAQVRIATKTGLMKVLAGRVADGLPALGTCAGLILLAGHVLDAGALDGFDRVGGLDVSVRRNAYGNQLASGERPVRMTDGTIVRGMFIRAPRIEQLADDVEVLAYDSGPDADVPVVVRQGNVIGCAFHPELVGEAVLHRLLLHAAARTRGTAYRPS